MTDEIENYILNHIDEEGTLLAKLNRETHVRILRPRMLSGHLQGRILKMLCRMIRPKRVLELGTFTGYSALCMIEGMPEDGVLTTIDCNDELEEFTQSYFDKSGYASRIRYILGDALKVIDALKDEQYDMIFIDADKREYVEYYEAVLPMLQSGGFILADNTLWDGKVLEPLAKNDAQTEGIMRFNDLIATDSRVEKVILPLRDGLTLLMKK